MDPFSKEILSNIPKTYLLKCKIGIKVSKMDFSWMGKRSIYYLPKVLVNFGGIQTQIVRVNHHHHCPNKFVCELGLSRCT